MTDTAKNSAAAEEGVYETPEDIAAEAAKTAERAARADADSPIAPVDPFEPGSLGWLLPWAETGEGDVLTPDEALEVFLEWVDARGMELWPHQEDALMDLAVGDSVILGTPTGSGKSMVALGLCFMAVATGRTAYYTAPIKALVSEKFFDMVDILGRENVGMITGDSTINTEAPVICCTAEILANQALREGPASKVACVVMDEFHFYADPDRGWAWQVPLLTLPNAQFLLMSATLGDVSDIASALEERTGRPVDLVTDAPRPVPLSYDYTFETLEATVELEMCIRDSAEDLRLRAPPRDGHLRRRVHQGLRHQARCHGLHGGPRRPQPARSGHQRCGHGAGGQYARRGGRRHGRRGRRRGARPRGCLLYTSTYRGLFEANELNDLAFVPLSPTLESTQGLVWRKTLPTRQAQAFLDTLKGLCAERDFENPPADAS